MNIKVGIVDYSLGNIYAIKNIFLSLNCHVLVSDTLSELSKCDLLILPGVGSFPYAMTNLKKKKLISFIIKWSEENKFILGICLGMQLLCNYSHENKKTKGLGIIQGNIVNNEENIANIGWNLLHCNTNDNFLKIGKKDYFYFNHSYCYKGPINYQLYECKKNPKIIAIIKHKNTYGVQFHPEKSQSSGLLFLKKFLVRVQNGN